MERKIRVELVDDHSVVRAGVRMLVEYQADMQVVAEAASANEAILQAAETRPDVIVLDIGLPGCSGLDAIPQLHDASSESRILILSTHDDPFYLRQAMARGAAGYVAKQAGAGELTQAIRAVAAGRSYINISLTDGRSLQGVVQAREPVAEGPVDELSRREKQVLALVAAGYTNQSAADELEISVKTVETYRSRLMEKLGVTSRADLVRIAIESGMIAQAAKSGG